MEDEFIEHVQKRIRNLQKRKSKLEGYETVRQNDPSKLNADQIAALANKDSVDAPLKELQEAVKLYQGAQDARATKHRQEIAEAVAAAEERGRNESRGSLRLFSLFLRTAAVKHQVNDTPAEELAAVDHLLQQLYLGDESSLEAIDKLAAKSDEIVHGKWTYAEINKLTSSPQKEESKPEEAVVEKTEETISFLQEDELEQQKPAAASQPEGEAQATKSTETSEKSEKSEKPKKEKTAGDKDQRKPRRKKSPNGNNGAPKKIETNKTDDGWEKAESRRGGDKKQNRNNRPQRKSN